MLRTILQADSSDLSRSLYRNTRRDLKIVGVDDGAFSPVKGLGEQALLVAVLFNHSRISSVRLGRILVDGRDGNKVLASILKPLRFDVTMLSGISFGGFNLVDIEELAKSTRRPVIAISREKPDNESVLRALRKHFADWEERWRIVQRAGRLYTFKPLQVEPALYFEVKGASPSFAKEAIASAATISRLPEPIRVAGIVARGLSGIK
jgi:endonuclease V-like protein UPF0215 family